MPLRVNGHACNFAEIDIGRELQDIGEGAVMDLRRLLRDGNNGEEDDGKKCSPHATSGLQKILRANMAKYGDRGMFSQSGKSGQNSFSLPGSLRVRLFSDLWRPLV